MSNKAKLTIFIIILVGLTLSSVLSAGEVAVTVNAAKVSGNISTKLTGLNVSWYYDTDALWSDGNMVSYLREIKSSLLRYPGGVETSHFHWELPYAHWKSDLWAPDSTYTPTSAYMNTDDLVARCRAIGAEPLIGINIKSGKKYNRVQDSINEAVRWVKYCRDHNYNVKYWYLENEPYYDENGGPMTSSEYAAYIAQFAPAMKAADPNIKIIIGWENKLSVPNYQADWKYIIKNAGKYVDIADVHWYWAWEYATWDLWLNDNPMKVREWCGDCPDKRYIGPSYVEDIKVFYDKIRDINGVTYPIELASLEWNIGPVKDRRFSQFQQALMQSEMLGQFIQGGLSMACIWPLTWSGDIHGDFRTVLDQEKHKPTPTFEMVKLYSNILGQRLLTCQSSRSSVPSLSALSQDGSTLWVFLLHKSGEGQTVNAEITIGGFAAKNAEAVAFTAPRLASDISKLDKVAVSAAGGQKWKCVLPPHSLTMLTFHKQ
jgi:alpha-N-arabinofuranosidase